MPTRLGAVIAERTLERAGTKRPVLARLGQPRPSQMASWECPYQVVGAGTGRVRVALGEDALQTILLACAGLRVELTRVKASWLGMGDSGIPPFLPDFLGAAFTVHLEAVVEKELMKFVAKLERAHERKARRLGVQPSNLRVKPTAVSSGAKSPARRRRRVRAGR